MINEELKFVNAHSVERKDKHTSGPWKVQRWVSGDVTVDCEDRILFKLVQLNSALEENANARLVAAAPDLLQTAKDILAYFEGDMCIELIDCVEQLESVIAKAI